MNWFYAVEGQQFGPVDDVEFQRLVGRAVVTDQTLVWRDGMPSWMPYGDVRGGAVPVSFAAAATALPHSSGLRYGGFWRRFVARFIDGFILVAADLVLRVPLFLMLGFPLGASFNPAQLTGMSMVSYFGLTVLINTAVAVAYEAYFLSGRGATPGKMVMGLQVIVTSGGPLTPGLAAGRYFAQWLSGAILAIGYLMAAFDPQKRALHDHICGTRVIRNR